MSSYAYYNGIFDKRKNISIPLSDRAIFFGDAIYDAAIGCYDRILWEKEHIERFLNNARIIGIKHEYTYEKLSALLREVAIKSMLKSYFIYFQLSRMSISRVHSAKNCESNLLITIDPFSINKSNSPIKLKTVNDVRYSLCNIKTTNLLPNVLASTAAEDDDCDEAVYIRDGYVTECSKSNILIIKQGRIITHPKTEHILPGIARAHILSDCAYLNIPFEDRPFSYEELISADEVLVSSTTKLVCRANKINGKPVGGKDDLLFTALRKELYEEYTNFCVLG